MRRAPGMHGEQNTPDIDREKRDDESPLILVADDDPIIPENTTP